LADALVVRRRVARRGPGVVGRGGRGGDVAVLAGPLGGGVLVHPPLLPSGHAGQALHGLPVTPAGDELVVLEPGEVLTQRARELARLDRRGVPEQRHLARCDLDDLHVVQAPGTGQQRRAAAALADQQLVGAVGPHASAPAAASSSRSPWKTRPSASATAGTSSTPAAAAPAVASSSRPAIDARPEPFNTAA